MTATELRTTPDWEVDFYSRPILEADGRKRWELLICSTPAPGGGAEFRWQRNCPADSVNSLWLREAFSDAMAAAAAAGFGAPRRLRCWRGAMRAMVQRAADGLSLELVASRRCFALRDWLEQREREVYPHEPGYLSGPLAPPPVPLQPPARPLPEAARGERWSWASLPAAALADAADWEAGFAALLPLPAGVAGEAAVPGIRLFSRRRGLAIAGWLAGLEPARLEISEGQLVLEAALDDRWRLAVLPADEAAAAAAAFATAREQAGGLQFLAVQSDDRAERFEGLWMLRDLPDG
ncbi:MAG: Tab2 family RNA-binding protein [Prochlorococcaceae cyanobacterium]